MADFSQGYCKDCGHPEGYHDAIRGCTMPLSASGLPLGRNEQQTGVCMCRASLDHQIEVTQMQILVAKRRRNEAQNEVDRLDSELSRLFYLQRKQEDQ